MSMSHAIRWLTLRAHAAPAAPAAPAGSGGGHEDDEQEEVRGRGGRLEKLRAKTIEGVDEALANVAEAIARRK